MIEIIKKILYKAGVEIIKIYNNISPQDYTLKTDNSPITRADLISNQIITEQLLKEFDYPILSEENIIDYSIRKNWKKFWLLDPLDGTKDFLAKNDEFCILLALIEKNYPIAGFIYQPATKDLYYAIENHGAYHYNFNQNLENKILPNPSINNNLLLSRFHDNERTHHFAQINNFHNFLRFGSGIKFVKLALGEAIIYPRFEGSKEWDIAPGYILLKECSLELLTLPNFQQPEFNKEDLKNPYFIAYNPNYINIKSLNFGNII